MFLINMILQQLPLTETKCFSIDRTESGRIAFQAIDEDQAQNLSNFNSGTNVQDFRLSKGALVDVPLVGGDSAVGHVKKFDTTGRVLVELADGSKIVGSADDARDVAPKFVQNLESVESVWSRLQPSSATFVITISFIAIFTVDMWFPAVGEWLLRQGCMEKEAFYSDGGQLWRLSTASFLHRDNLHLMLNMFALLHVGTDLEEFYGRSRFALLYLCCSLSSSLFSGLWNSGASSIGASGAIYGCIAVHHVHRLFACREKAFRIQLFNIFICGASDALLLLLSQAKPLKIVSSVAVVLCNEKNNAGKMRWPVIATRMPTVVGPLLGFDSNIDHAGHLGGFLAGILLGAILLPNHFSGDPDNPLIPPHQDRQVDSCKGARKKQRTRDPASLRAEKAWRFGFGAALLALWAAS